MFLVKVNIVNPSAITEGLEGHHIAYVKGKYECCEDFLHIGSLMSESGGGVYVFKWKDKKQVEAFIAKDPFSQAGIAEYEIHPYLVRHNRFEQI